MRTSGSFLYKNGLYTVMCAQAIVITIQSSETINIEKLIPMCTSLSFISEWSIKVSELWFWSFEEADVK
jgi:hypothetical protein